MVPPEDPDAPKGFEFEAAKTRDKLEQARLRKLERDVGFRLQAKQMLEEEKAAAAAARNKTKAQLQKEEEDMFMTVFARKHKMNDMCASPAHQTLLHSCHTPHTVTIHRVHTIRCDLPSLRAAPRGKRGSDVLHF
jgi:hypothetical protein